MGTRILLGCIAALATMLVFALLIAIFDSQLNRAIDTGLGAIALVDLLSTLTAMFVGGWVARRRFRWVAVALAAVSWLAILMVLLLSAGPASPASMASPMALLQYNGLAIVLSLALAWLGAALGERVASHRHRGAAPLA